MPLCLDIGILVNWKPKKFVFYLRKRKCNGKACFCLIELNSFIYQLACADEYIFSLKQGDLRAASRFIESGQIHIDAAVSEVSSCTVCDFLGGMS